MRVGASVFGQITMQWYLMLAVTGFLTEYQYALEPSPVKPVTPVYVKPVT